jgi:hypothetical protein
MAKNLIPEIPELNDLFAMKSKIGKEVKIIKIHSSCTRKVSSILHSLSFRFEFTYSSYIRL